MNITNEDNIELMGRYEDNYFDLAIVDPPYGISIHKMNYTQSTKGGSQNEMIILMLPIGIKKHQQQNTLMN